MKKRLVSVVALVLLLTGCNSTVGTIQKAATARDECHNLGGVFSMGQTEDGSYWWSCDLSDSTPVPESIRTSSTERES